MNEHLYYNQVPCAEYSAIQREVFSLIESTVSERKLKQDSFSLLDHDAILEQCTTLTGWLTDIGAGPVRVIRLLLVPPNSSSVIHTDTSNVALNIGLQSAGTTTKIFSLVSGEPLLKYVGYPFWHYDDCTLKVEHTYDLSPCPVVLNTHQIHQISNPVDDWRVSISIRFVNDPWHLFN